MDQDGSRQEIHHQPNGKVSGHFDARAAALDKLDRYALLLDGKFRIPGTSIRFGWDPILGLVPGFGDVVGFLMSLYLVVQAVRLGVSRRIAFAMLGNIGVEALLGMVPVLGDLFDAGFKANTRNVRLLRLHIGGVERVSSSHQSTFRTHLLLLIGLLAVAIGLFVVVCGVFLRYVAG